ncbi:MAG: hypothetical protein ACP5KN_14105 [Armatimonadota bacterium]
MNLRLRPASLALAWAAALPAMAAEVAVEPQPAAPRFVTDQAQQPEFVGFADQGPVAEEEPK